MQQQFHTFVQVTPRSPEVGWNLLAWRGVWISLGTHTVVLTALYVAGWWPVGGLDEPVVPYPPEQDYAAIEIPPSRSASQADAERPPVEVLRAEAVERPRDMPLPPAMPPRRMTFPDGTWPMPSAAGTDPASGDPGDAARWASPPTEHPAPRAEDAPSEAPAVEPLVAMGALSRARTGVEERVTPRVLLNPAPRYPSDALARRLQGTVLLHVVVSADGEATDVRIVRSSGHASLDDAAVEAVRRWRFLPARDPRAAPREVRVPIEFVLRAP